jgi:predicted nucleic acid-binding protein
MAGKALRRQYILDAGALIAYERRNRRVAALIELAAEHRIEIVLPSAVLAQVWLDGSQIGELLRTSGTTDVVDAHVAALSEHLNAPVITPDPDDLTKLSPAIDVIAV